MPRQAEKGEDGVEERLEYALEEGVAEGLTAGHEHLQRAQVVYCRKSRFIWSRTVVKWGQGGGGESRGGAGGG